VCTFVAICPESAGPQPLHTKRSELHGKENKGKGKKNRDKTSKENISKEDNSKKVKGKVDKGSKVCVGHCAQCFGLHCYYVMKGNIASKGSFAPNSAGRTVSTTECWLVHVG
jgi:hypothetical protein